MFSMTAYFLAGSKFVGRTMTPWISVLPSRPFATNTSGAFHPAFVSSPMSRPLELVGLGVTRGPQLEYGREVDAGVGIDVVLGVG